MTMPQSPVALLLLFLAAPIASAAAYVPWPSKDQLRTIQNAAFSCSRENSSATCQKVRELADPLMDHPRLTGLCKDALWDVMEQAKVYQPNNYKRRDAIDTPARRILKLCAEPEKKQTKPGGSPGGPQLRQS